MEEPTYWNRFWRRRLSRRRLLTGAALTGSGLAAAVVVGCGGDESGTDKTKSDGGGEGGLGEDLESQVPQFIDARREVVPAPADMRGGTLRFQGFDPVVLDRHDPHQTQFGPMYANLSSVFSKLYMYKSHTEPTWENIVPDLAESAPEMIGNPPTEYVVKLRKGVKFHDTDAIRSHFPDLAGRELKAEDVVFSYDRQRNPDSIQKGYYYRASQYRTIDTIQAVDDYTIRIKTKGPIAPFYHFMADTNAMIVPKEIVDMEPGPGGLPLDTVDTNRGPAPGERMIGTGPFFWGDLKFGIEYKALRNPAWFGWGEWRMQGPVGNAISYWALPYDELLTLPGYRQTKDERTKDVTEARQLFEAAGSPEFPQIWFAYIPSYIPNFVGTWKQFMNQNLGIPIDKLRTLTQAYSRIAEAIADDSCDLASMTWGFDNGWIDLDDWVYPYFHSTGSKNSFRLKDPDLDTLLDAQRTEFDYEKRKELGYRIQRYLLGLEGDGMQKGAHARTDYATPRTATVAWPYFKNRVAFPWFGNSYWSANVWLDKNNPTIRGRPA